MGGTRTDIHTPEKRNIRPLPTINPQTKRGETMEQFHSALRSLAEHCQLAHLQDELLRDIFTANMIDHEIQKELLKTTLTPEKALELAVSIELGVRSQLAIHSKQLSDPHQNAFVGREGMISEISSARFCGSNRTTTPRGPYRGNNRPTFNNSRNRPPLLQKLWTNMGHQSQSQMPGNRKTCRRCNKPNHFAKVCRSNLNRPPTQRSINEVDNQSMEQSSDGINMISLQAEIQSTYGN